MSQKVRVRFAPSPTGGLHLGGVRTVLYNYLFAKKHGGDFVLRIEDTDQSRFVPGAEAYILECLEWCGLTPDESVLKPGAYGPYRQSERKEIYQQYAHKLVDQGDAYYAFDTPAELEAMRENNKTAENPSPTYNQQLRKTMRNSLSMEIEEARELIADGTPYVVRIKMPEDEVIGFTDLIRGAVNFNTSQVDDKVLLKADGMPTYHLAVVVDDYLMKITHAFRGEEWLSSAPVHLMLWQKLGWEEQMPEWAHLPLIMGPDGAKLSKRHGNKYGFPIFAMNWTDPVKNEFTEGFRERGFLPEAFINLLALMGWNDGTGQEIFTKDEMIAKFDMARVHSAGAQFDFEKAKWYNHEWIKHSSAERLLPDVKNVLQAKGITVANDATLTRAIELVKERCVLLNDFYEQSAFFFTAPATIDTDSLKGKWNEQKTLFFTELLRNYELTTFWNAQDLEHAFKEIAAVNGIKPGELMLPFRIMLVGGKFGPGVFDIAELIGKEATLQRITTGLALL
ncbi:MAG TPA: glutamate--tRNA ligase [Phnomibacter sp.]|nr:glutamate--tRNA ligase [Phnomibacter sp.]